MLSWKFPCQESTYKANKAFSQVWNEFIYSMRNEDLISNRLRSCWQKVILYCYLIMVTIPNNFVFLIMFSERDLLLVPMPNPSSVVSVEQWPSFLLASKVRSMTLCL